MKIFSKRTLSLALAALMALFTLAGAAETETAVGADAVKSGETYTLEQMLTYALQDEYLAEAQYKAIAEKYGAVRPFSSIVVAESTHIAKLTALMTANGFTVPENNAAQQVTVPDTAEDALKLGAATEEKNIAMYDNFLQQSSLTSEAKTVFETLKKASEKHLASFSRSTARTGAQQDAANGAAVNGGGRGTQKRSGMRQNGTQQNGTQQSGTQQDATSGATVKGGNGRGMQNRDGGMGGQQGQFDQNGPYGRQRHGRPMNGQTDGVVQDPNQNNASPSTP